MDPQASPQPVLSPDVRPVMPPVVEVATGLPEQQPQPVARELAPAPTAPPPTVPGALPLTQTLAAVAPVATVPPVAPVALNTSPAIAEDVDVIEKEWVDKAQQVVQEHKDDPYQEEEAIENLQIDYLKKRYGVEIKKDQPGN